MKSVRVTNIKSTPFYFGDHSGTPKDLKGGMSTVIDILPEHEERAVRFYDALKMTFNVSIVFSDDVNYTLPEKIERTHFTKPEDNPESRIAEMRTQARDKAQKEHFAKSRFERLKAVLGFNQPIAPAQNDVQDDVNVFASNDEPTTVKDALINISQDKGTELNEVSMSLMTVSDLKDVAKEMNLKLPASATKAEIIKSISENLATAV